MFIAKEIFAANNVGGIESGNKSIKKCEKLVKIGKSLKSQKLSKLGNSKSKKLSKS